MALQTLHEPWAGSDHSAPALPCFSQDIPSTYRASQPAASIRPHSLLHLSVLSPCCIHPHSLLIHPHSLLIHPEPLCPALGLQRAGRGLTSCLSWEQNNFCSDPEQRGWLGCPWQGAAQCSPWMGNAFFGRTPALAVLLINFSAGTNYGPQVLLTCCVFHVPAPFLPSACFCFSFSCADSSAQARQVLGCASGSSSSSSSSSIPCLWLPMPGQAGSERCWH